MSKPGVFEKVGECLYRYSNNGTYYGRFEVNRKEIRVSLRTTDKRHAERILLEKIRIAEGKSESAGKMPLCALIDKYIGTIGHLAKSTFAARKSIALRFKKNWPGGSSVATHKVPPSVIRSVLAALDVGPDGYNAHLAVLRAIFDLAVEDGVIHESPVAKVKSRKREKPIRKTPTEAEYHAILADILAQVYNPDAKDSADFVEFLGESGLGKIEAASAKWADVDFKTNQLTTFRHKTKKGFQIPIYPNLRKLLLRLKEDDPHEPSDKILKIADPKKAIAGACSRLGLPAYSSRSFRRYFITKAIYKGVNVKTISQWQGHSDGGKLILDTYSHVLDGESQKLAKLMGDTEQKPSAKKKVK